MVVVIEVLDVGVAALDSTVEEMVVLYAAVCVEGSFCCLADFVIDSDRDFVIDSDRDFVIDSDRDSVVDLSFDCLELKVGLTSSVDILA